MLLWEPLHHMQLASWDMVWSCSSYVFFFFKSSSCVARDFGFLFQLVFFSNFFFLLGGIYPAILSCLSTSAWLFFTISTSSTSTKTKGEPPWCITTSPHFLRRSGGFYETSFGDLCLFWLYVRRFCNPFLTASNGLFVTRPPPLPPRACHELAHRLHLTDLFRRISVRKVWIV